MWFLGMPTVSRDVVPGMEFTRCDEAGCQVLHANGVWLWPLAKHIMWMSLPVSVADIRDRVSNLNPLPLRATSAARIPESARLGLASSHRPLRVAGIERLAGRR